MQNLYCVEISIFWVVEGTCATVKGVKHIRVAPKRKEEKHKDGHMKHEAHMMKA